MKHALRTGLIILSLVAVPAFASAGKHADDLAAYDADGDGKLDQDERRAMYGDQAGDNFANLDADGDGLVSLAEAEAKSRILAHRFHAVDTDDDGYLTRAELSSTRKKPVR